MLWACGKWYSCQYLECWFENELIVLNQVLDFHDVNDYFHNLKETLLSAKFLRVRLIAYLLHHVLYKAEILHCLNKIFFLWIYNLQCAKYFSDSYFRSIGQNNVLVLLHSSVMFKHKITHDVQEWEWVNLINLNVLGVSLDNEQQHKMPGQPLQKLNHLIVYRLRILRLLHTCICYIDRRRRKQVPHAWLKRLHLHYPVLIREHLLRVLKFEPFVRFLALNQHPSSTLSQIALVNRLLLYIQHHYWLDQL